MDTGATQKLRTAVPLYAFPPVVDRQSTTAVVSELVKDPPETTTRPGSDPRMLDEYTGRFVFSGTWAPSTAAIRGSP